MIVSGRVSGCAVLVIAGWVSCAAPCLGHQCKCFATAEGSTIAGYAWFGGGGRPKGTEVRATSPDGTVLYEGKTNDKGEFAFEARVRCDHIIRVGGGEGHAAQFTVKAEELPESLPAAAGPPKAAPGPVEVSRADEAGGGARVAPGTGEALVKQVAALRAELEAFRSEQRFRDVVAGIGYILGLAGVAFFFLGGRRGGKGGA